MGFRVTGIIILFLALLASCDYPLNSKYVSAIKPPPPLNVVVDIESPNFTTPFYLDWPTAFTLKLQNLTGFIESYSVTVDSQDALPTISVNVLQFYLNPAVLGTGTHTIKVAVKTRTQSGSLADQLDAEFYSFEKSFTVIVDPSLPQVTVPPSYKIENGYLTLRWNIGSTRIYSYTLYGPSGTTTFNGAGQMAYIDSGYVGSPASYQLVISNFQNYSYFPAQEVQIGAHFRIQAPSNLPATITWQPLFADANVIIAGPNGSTTLPMNAAKISLDSTFLGDQKSYRVYVSRNNYPSQAFDTTFRITTTPQLPAFDGMSMLAAQSKLLISGAPIGIRRYDLATLNLEDNVFSHFYSGVATTFSVSADGQYGAFAEGGPPAKFKPMDFTQTVSYLTEIPGPVQNGSYLTVSTPTLSSTADNGLQGASIAYNGDTRAAILDLTQDAYTVVNYTGVVWMDSINQDTPVLSDDGQFFSVNSSDQSVGMVYKNISGTWTVIGQVQPGKKIFRNNSTHELIVVGNKVMIYDVSTPVGANNSFTPVRTFDYAAALHGNTATQIGFDGSTQNIFIETISSDFYSTIRTYNVDNFAMNGKCKAYLSPATIPARHIYANNYHFLSTGYIEKLP